jgi:hypothetical protein
MDHRHFDYITKLRLVSSPTQKKSGQSKSATDFDTYKVQPWINDLPQGQLVTDLVHYMDAGAMALAETNEQ